MDKGLLLTVISLSILGLLIFFSASLGLLVRDTNRFELITTKQFLVGFLGGLVGLYIFSRIPYLIWKKLAPILFLLSLSIVALVFVPGYGIEGGGAKRWIAIKDYSFQPAELLKLSFVFLLAAVFSRKRYRSGSFTGGFLPFIIIIGLVAVPLLMQPDTGTFAVFLITGIAIYLTGGGSWKQFFLIFLIAFAGLAYLAYSRPYVRDRITTFVNPSHDRLGSSYQIQQALIAVGSGKTFGRGFGQSVQKFNFLPEPAGDSIFAVVGEEFGFIGSSIIVLLFLIFGMRGLSISARAPDNFGRLVALGLTILIVSQSFINIAAILGLIPLTGVPLLFMSHGGTALLFALIETGIILNISRHT